MAAINKSFMKSHCPQTLSGILRQ